MKKVLTILVFSTLCLVGYSQQNLGTVNDKSPSTIIKGNKYDPAEKVSTIKVKTQLIKINYKKSNQIISIKAYRKSLQIKVKTIKLC